MPIHKLPPRLDPLRREVGLDRFTVRAYIQASGADPLHAERELEAFKAAGILRPAGPQGEYFRFTRIFARPASPELERKLLAATLARPPRNPRDQLERTPASLFVRQVHTDIYTAVLETTPAGTRPSRDKVLEHLVQRLGYAPGEARRALRAVHRAADVNLDWKDAFRRLQQLRAARPGAAARHLEDRAPTVTRLALRLDERLRLQSEGRIKPIPTPWRSVTEGLGGGLSPGLVLLGGRTGCGKTQFGLQCVLMALRKGVRVVYLSVEIEAEQVLVRLIALMLDVPWSSLWNLGPGDEKPDRFAEARAWLEAQTLLLIEEDPKHFSEKDAAVLATTIRERWPDAPRYGNPVLVVVDYIQLMGDADARGSDSRTEVANAAYGLRTLAREHNLTVLAISSTARHNYKELLFDLRSPKTSGARKKSDGAEDQRPTHPTETNPTRLVGLGKESGDTEYAANAVLVLVQVLQDGDTPTSREVCLAIAKRRAGPPGWVRLHFNGSQFSDPGHGFMVGDTGARARSLPKFVVGTDADGSAGSALDEIICDDGEDDV